jgi:hypothetical protein
MAFGTRSWSGAMIAVLAVSSALAQTASPPPRPAPHPPLQPGPSAGVQAAQQVIRPGLALIGAGAIIALVVVTTAGNGSKASQPGSQSVPATAP